MIVSIDESECIGCGRCEEECPAIFELDSDLVSKVKRQPEAGEEKCAETAADACPATAISVE
ncbi:MAG: ferredoxin [Candidatus Methanomethylophilaceae archaeon]|nr:ferredoxin [Candidatus Methanomethylophilaceae archaeon]